MEVNVDDDRWLESSFREAMIQLSPHRNHTLANLLLQLHASKLQTSTRAVFLRLLRPAANAASWHLRSDHGVDDVRA